MADRTSTPASEFAYFHAPILSFYAGDLYRDVAQKWRGSGLLYLLFLCAVMTIPDAAQLHVEVGRALRPEAVGAVETMKPLVFKDGILSTDQPQPFELITNPDTGLPRVIVDTTGTVTSLDTSPALALLMKDRMLLKSPDGRVDVWLWKSWFNGTVDGPQLLEEMASLRSSSAFYYYPVATVTSFVWLAVMVMLLSLAARMMVARAGKQLPPPVLHRLSAIAVTPALVTTTLLTAFGVLIPAQLLLGTLMTMGYLTFALSSVLDPQDAQNDDDD